LTKRHRGGRPRRNVTVTRLVGQYAFGVLPAASPGHTADRRRSSRTAGKFIAIRTECARVAPVVKIK
jgi:hypothetical protein